MADDTVYLKTTHEVYHYFKLDGWQQVRWRKEWDGNQEHQSIEYFDNGEWKRVNQILRDEYIVRLKQFFGTDTE